MKKNLPLSIFLLSCILCAPLWLLAQPGQVGGVVKDATSNESLPGVTVRVKGGGPATSTGENGTFQLQAEPNALLVFSLVGYQNLEVPVNNQSTINVSLSQDQSELSEVVVTAMGIERTERSLGYATQKIDNKLLNNNRQPNMVNALQGKAAGVTVTSTGGAPGQGARIQIRGITSLDPNRPSEPLFVIDGVLMDNSTSTVGSGSDVRGVSNRGVDINPDDIESMNILRGGAATALYGLRGANGVVVITTKSGKSGRINVDYTGTFGFENVNKYPKLQKTYTQGWAGNYDPNDFWPSWGPTVEEARAIDPTHPAQLYDHLRDAFETGHQYRNNVTISGGSERITFLTSLSQLNQTGIIPTTDFKNYQGRANLNAKISDKLSVGASLNFTNSGSSNRINAIRYNEQLIYWSPRHDVRDYLDENGKMQSYGATTNPLYVATTNRLSDNTDRVLGNFNVSYDPLSWLNFSFRAGLDSYGEQRQRTAPGFEGLPGERLVDENGAFGAAGQGFVFDYNTRFRTINTTFFASAKHSFNNGINGTLRLGHELYDRDVKTTGIEGGDLTVYNWFDIRNANILQTVQNIEQYRLMGIIGELSLDYKQQLYLTLTGRNDITSSLQRPNNSFFYPSASLSYVFSDSFKLPEVISSAKARLSYASMGKDASPYSMSRGFASFTSLPAGYVGFTRPSLLGDPELRPEFVNTYEGGLDLAFLNNRLTLEATYYSIISKDQIMSIPVSSSTGYLTAAVNAGKMRNRGIELTIGGTPVSKPDFSWNTNLNFSLNRNMVLELAEGLDEIFVASQSGYLNSAVSMRLIAGQPYGSLFGTTYQRYYSPEELSGFTPAQVRNYEHLGLNLDDSRPIVIGENGFPVRNPIAVQQILGNVQPRWIGGWNNTFNYKSLSLNLLFDARIGHYKYNQLNNFYAAFGMADYTLDRNDYRVFEGVLADGTPNTREVWLGQGVDPRTDINYGDGYYRNVYRGVSEHSVEDASWVRLRSASISYNLPQSWIANNFVKHVNVGVTGNNLWIWTKYRGYDPEASSFNSGSVAVDGFGGFTAPGVRTFLFNLNVGF